MTFFAANDSIQATKMPEQNKAKKKEKFKKPKNLGGLLQI